MTIYSIGHSTRPIDEFINILKSNRVFILCDIRSMPGSDYVPQYNAEALADSLLSAGITYVHIKELGGLKKKAAPNSVNLGWRNLSFRNYADYMQTPEFELGMNALESAAKERVTAIMCSEAVPWRCHRSLVSDALIVRGWNVLDLIKTQPTQHKMTPFIKVDGKHITYPAMAQ